MTVDIRRAEPEDLPEILEVDQQSFHYRLDPEGLELVAASLDTNRFFVASTDSHTVDGHPSDGRIVGLAGSYPLELTLPGPATLPMTGVTWISVLPSHRRRGLARQLIAAVERDGAERDEPVLGLNATQAGIYRRFGYGIATTRLSTTIDRRLVQLRPEAAAAADVGRVILRPAVDAIDDLAAIWDRYRRAQPGEVSQSVERLRYLTHLNGPDALALLHPDGFAVFTTTKDWSDGLPAHAVEIHQFCASTDDAHLALWHYLFGLDLAGPISGRFAVVPGDRLPALVTDSRAITTTTVQDNLWVKVADIPRAFAARSYRINDELVLGIADEAWAVSNSGCTPTGRPPDLLLDSSAVGPLLLGGVSATHLARAGWAHGSPATLHRADAFFGWEPAPVTRAEF